jgi:4-amino-4-deoxy-L-arabinose transferase-like glycosyltransferase
MVTAISPESSSARERNRGSFAANAVIVLAVSYWVFQIVWFWRYCGHNINADAISYIGIARHVAGGDFRASLHGYWSPLISWLLAGTRFYGVDWTLSARLLMFPLFVLCQVLLYWLTQRLWNSRLLSALAVLWFTAARGVAAFSVCFIGADLLLTATILLYFILLLACLEQPARLPRWFGLGAAHGIAFLAKAIAMPLLAFATLLALLFTHRRKSRKTAAALVMAAIFPALIWLAWGKALQQKYGVFITGYQLRWNLLDPAVKRSPNKSKGLVALLDTTSTYDSFMVTEQMPPGSRFWQIQVWQPSLIRQVLGKELENIPRALKELLVLLTPGGVLAVILCVLHLTRSREVSAAHFHFIWIVLFTIAALVVAYSLLVFDGRYVLPVTPALIALGIRFVLPPGAARFWLPADLEKLADAGRWQTAAGILLVLGLIGTQVYWASPFRARRQDFQQSVYAAADSLKNRGARNIVVIGDGPYPEDGVGWEAGLYAAYFADSRVLATLLEIPAGLNPDAVVADIEKVGPDAIMIWGSPMDSRYSSLLSALQLSYPEAASTTVSDPQKGSVGRVFVLRR